MGFGAVDRDYVTRIEADLEVANAALVDVAGQIETARALGQDEGWAQCVAYYGIDTAAARPRGAHRRTRDRHLRAVPDAIAGAAFAPVAARAVWGMVTAKPGMAAAAATLAAVTTVSTVTAMTPGAVPRRPAVAPGLAAPGWDGDTATPLQLQSAGTPPGRVFRRVTWQASGGGDTSAMSTAPFMAPVPVPPPAVAAPLAPATPAAASTPAAAAAASVPAAAPVTSVSAAPPASVPPLARAARRHRLQAALTSPSLPATPRVPVPVPAPTGGYTGRHRHGPLGATAGGGT